MEFRERKPTRLQNYDYSSNGYYFITICTRNKQKLLSHIVGDGAYDVPSVKLTPIGKIVEKYIISSNNIDKVSVAKYVIMPNHIHLLIFIDDAYGSSRAPTPTNNTISHLVSTLKRFVNRAVGKNVFQRSFHDHVVRGDKDYEKIWNYIETNPQSWEKDKYY